MTRTIKMRFSIAIIFLTAISQISYSQSPGSVNFSYLYKPSGQPDFQFHPVATGDDITFYYSLKGENPATGYYIVLFERRDSYGQREGTPVVAGASASIDTIRLVNGAGEGKIVIPKPAKPWLLSAKVIDNSTSTAWYFLKLVEARYPVNGFLEKNGVKQWSSYYTVGSNFVVQGSGSGKPIHFSFYRENFPSPSPPFAEKELKMERFVFPDSSFTINPGEQTGSLKSTGLYLAQEDTLSEQGFSFMIHPEPYPKYNKIADLKGPLLFVTTKQENDQIGAAGEDKTKFDKVVLDITNDKERAKIFMRNYFKRVEYANTYFTSFKEGWKTDRGMIFIVFGAPDEVTLNGQQEIWGYKSPRQKFVFVKSGSVYSPDHFVLIRDSHYTEAWYQTIDLWRKSRF